MRINKNAIRLKVGQTSTSSPTLNVNGNQLIKSEGTQTINTSGAQNLFNDSNLVDDYFLKGGYKVVSDITCRNNIPCEYRKLGMQVMVVGPDASFKRYILKGHDPCSNEGWEELLSATNEVEVKLVEDYSVLDSSLESQRDLNLYFKNNLITLNESLGDFVDKISDQTIDGTKSFLQRINLKNSTLDVNSSNRTLRFSENTFTYPSVVKDSILTGYNILPLLNPLVSGNETWLNGAGYIAYGVNIFKDFTGNTSYRPSHNAHDSWLGFGRRLGSGVIDGTNITLIGTDVFHRNVTKYWDSITAIGKGITTGLTVGSHIPNGDTPFYPISKPAFNMRGLVGQIVAIGAEQWFGDLHTSITIGNNIKKYKYGFNSVIIGNEIQNYSDSTITQQQLDENSFDNDVIIGNGLWKNPNRYAQTHNLIIGNQTGYGAGGWSSAYIPLIEGNFKTPFLRINGKFSNTDERSLYTPDASYHQSGYLTRPLSLVSIPAGASGSVTFDSATGNLVFTNAPAGRYVLAENIPPGNYFYTALNSNMSRTYNIRILSYSYNNAVLGFPYADFHVYSDGTYPTNEFAIELTDTTSGTIQCALKYVDTNNLIKSIDKVYDKDKNLVLETKTSTLANSTVLVGSEVAKKYFTGINNAIFGNFNLSVASRLNSSSIVGTNNAKLLEAADKIIIVGNNNLNKLTYGNQIFSIGTNNFPNATNMQWSYTFGDSNFTNFIGGPTEDTTYNSNLIGIGRGVAGNLISGQNAILMGRNTGLGATSINNSIAIVPNNGGGNTFGTTTPDNAIVISGNATTGFGNNTTTIGNPSTVASYIYGDLFKINSLNFDLKSSITIRPNMLVPKVDGSRLIWYNNSSVPFYTALFGEFFEHGYGAGNIDSNVIFGQNSFISNTTGVNNVAIGSDTLSKVTTQVANTAIGSSSLKSLGIDNGQPNVFGIPSGYNSAIGGYSMRFVKEGINNVVIGGMTRPGGFTDGSVLASVKGNVAIGVSSMNNATTAYMNTVIGTGAASYLTSGMGNIVIGYSAAVGLKTGVNNIFIGNGAGGQAVSTPDVSDKLCIENRRYNINNNSDLENRISPYLTDYKKGLISGDFNVREVNIDGKFSITPSRMPIADTTYTKNIVAKTDGTFGWTDGLISDKVRFNLSAVITPTPNTLVPKTDGSGLLWYDNNSITKAVLLEGDAASGDIKDVKFTLQTSISPTPNTLVPKTDGSGLLWYNNNSVAGELFTGTPFIYNVPSTITVTNINTPVQPNPPSYVQAIKDRITQLHQPGVVMQKFDVWNIVKYAGITDNTTRVDNNDKITTYLQPYKENSLIQVNEDVISVYTDRVLPFNKDWAISFNLNIGIFDNGYNISDIANTNRILGLYTNGSGILNPTLFISDGKGAFNEITLKLTSTKYISSNSGTNTSNVIYTNNKKAEIYGFILKAGNNILVQLQFGSSSISEIYLADNFLTDSFGFAVSVSKQNTAAYNSQTGKISNIRHYIFP